MQNESRSLFALNNFESTCFTKNVFYTKIAWYLRENLGAFPFRTRTFEIVWDKCFHNTMNPSNEYDIKLKLITLIQKSIAWILTEFKLENKKTWKMDQKVINNVRLKILIATIAILFHDGFKIRSYIPCYNN